MIDDKYMEDIEYFNYLGAMITNDGKCTSDSKYRFAMTKQISKRRLLTILT
jgi:hypothetical protein